MLIILPSSYVNADPEKIDEGIYILKVGECAPEDLTCFDSIRVRELSESTTEANLCMEELGGCRTDLNVAMGTIGGFTVGFLSGGIIVFILTLL